MPVIVNEDETDVLDRKFINIFTYVKSESKRMGEITILTKATTKSESLRTTIPISIVRQFNLSERDKLIWEIRAERKT